MSSPLFFRATEMLEKVQEIRDYGILKGKSCGIISLDEYFTLKKGFPLFVAGAPFSGKTELVLEVLVNTSILYGWKHFIYVGEGGDTENIVTELVQKFLEKPIIKTNPYHAVDVDFIKAMAWVHKHFVIANHDKEFTISEFYATVLQAETETGIKFDTTLFDPFNDIKEEVDTYGGREDKYLASALKTVRVDAKRNNRINILVNHIADVRAVVDQKTGARYMPPAMPNEWAGGRTWWRRAFTMLLVYRPPSFMSDENGQPYAQNESHIFIQKSKPKGVGRTGMAKIFWDWKKNRYYSYSDTGQQLYSCQTPATEAAYIKSLTEVNSTFLGKENDDNPF